MNKRAELTTLGNGVRLVVVDTPGLEAATVEVFWDVGSKYEEQSEFGYSHFLEHLAFKGSSKWPTPELVFKELDGRGVSYNASTGLELTSYYIKCLPKDVGWANEFLADILLNPLLDPKELEKEKGVVLEEMAMYQDNPMMGLGSEYAKKLIYSPSGKGCFNVIGEKMTIAKADSQKIAKFRKKYLDSRRVVIVVCGDRNKLMSWDKLQVSVEKEWKSLDQSITAFPSLVLKMDQFRTIKEKGLEQAHLVLGWPGINRNSKKKYVEKMVEVLLAGNFSARLVSLLREKMGVAYYVHPDGEQLKEIGYMGIQAGVKRERLEEVVDLVYQEVRGMKDNVTQDELSRAKEYLLGTTRLMMDKSQFWSDFIGQQVLLDNKLVDLEKELEKYAKVSLLEVKSFCEEYLDMDRASLLAIR